MYGDKKMTKVFCGKKFECGFYENVDQAKENDFTMCKIGCANCILTR